jgi:hypothetical protein
VHNFRMYACMHAYCFARLYAKGGGTSYALGAAVPSKTS